MLTNPKQAGFTLLEILIALFIFTILSLMLAGALRTVINAQSGTENSAERLRELQLSLLRFSRDVEQITNRPILNAQGKEEPAFIGTPKDIIFTHFSATNSMEGSANSVLQRTTYYVNGNSFWRRVYKSVDEVDDQSSKRRLLGNIVTLRFQYLDKEKHFQDYWPPAGKSKEALPQAVRINLTIGQWGKLSQLYVIPAKTSQTTQIPSLPKKS